MEAIISQKNAADLPNFLPKKKKKISVIGKNKKRKSGELNSIKNYWWC